MNRLPKSKLFALLASLAVAGPAAAQDAPPSPAHQIASAVLAAPADARDGAKVLGWNAEGRVITLREGTNDFVCLADNPAVEAWSVACYPTSLDPYMERGRKLREQGVTDGQENLRQRWAEADAGTLPMPEEPAALYILHGQGFDEETGEVIEPFLRWAVYTPWATPESTGLPTQPTGPGAPWLMFAGTPASHIMITPELPESMRRGREGN